MQFFFIIIESFFREFSLKAKTDQNVLYLLTRVLESNKGQLETGSQRLLVTRGRPENGENDLKAFWQLTKLIMYLKGVQLSIYSLQIYLVPTYAVDVKIRKEITSKILP